MPFLSVPQSFSQALPVNLLSDYPELLKSGDRYRTCRTRSVRRKTCRICLETRKGCQMMHSSKAFVSLLNECCVPPMPALLICRHSSR